MKLKTQYIIIPAMAISAILVSCEKKETASNNEKKASKEEAHGHPHDGEEADDHDHEHDEVSLGSFNAGELKIEASQGHGMVEAGKEGHLVIKLPYKDDGSSVVRAWIGSSDRTLSAVGKGEYAAAHDDYDIHAIAPTPLPADAKWWVEIEKPDGTKLVGSVEAKK